MTPVIPIPPASADVLLEFVNMGVGRAARSLSELTNREVAIAVPTLELLNPTEYEQRSMMDCGISLRINQAFSGGMQGQALLVLNRPGAIRLAHLLLGKSEGDDAFDDQEQGALLELGNIVIGNVMGLLASELDAPVDFELPQLQLRGITNFFELISDLPDTTAARLIIMRASLAIKEDKISGYIILVFPETSLHRLIAKLACLTNP